MVKRGEAPPKKDLGSELICVVEKDGAASGCLSRLLRSAGYSVCTLSTAQEFLPYADRATCLVLNSNSQSFGDSTLQDDSLAGVMMVPIALLRRYVKTRRAARGPQTAPLTYIAKSAQSIPLIAAVGDALERCRVWRTALAAKTELSPRYQRLTLREREVMDLVATGLLNKQIAALLEIREITVKVHRGNMMRKMGAQSLPDLVRMADSLGLPPVSGSRDVRKPTKFDQ
jgi:FixJ family two-component response regulator